MTRRVAQTRGGTALAHKEEMMRRRETFRIDILYRNVSYFRKIPF